MLYGLSLVYLFGIDDFGRDLFICVVVGMKLIFLILIILVVIVVIFGVLLGIIVGYFNYIDNLIMWILDVVFVILLLLLVVVIIVLFGVSILNLIIVLSIGNILLFVWIMCVSVLEIKCMEYVDVVCIIGENIWNIIWCYILLNVIVFMIVCFLLNIGVVVLIISSLSFLGFGVVFDVVEWGNILCIGSNYLEMYSNLVIVFGVCIMFVVLVFNFIGDVVCDVLDLRIY